MKHIKHIARPTLPVVPDRLCTPEEAAEILGVARQTLAHWRVKGHGPTWVRLNARTIRYSATELSEWIRTHRRTRTV